MADAVGSGALKVVFVADDLTGWVVEVAVKAVLIVFEVPLVVGLASAVGKRCLELAYSRTLVGAHSEFEMSASRSSIPT